MPVIPAAADGLHGCRISGLTGIVGTFFVKDYLGLSQPSSPRSVSGRRAVALKMPWPLVD